MCLNDTIRIPGGLPDPGVPCCDGSAFLGPGQCTCLTEDYDLDQQPLRPGLPLPPVPLRMCVDCAYRPGSPERSGDPLVSGDAETLEDLAVTGEPFFCHRGIRLAIRLRHPSGLTAEIPGRAAYRPPAAGNVPYKADGTPADICAGWLLRRAALTRTGRAA